ncbi:MAG: ATP-binding protein [Candidatus Hydrothermia bacterium]|jgi:transitional endoplasmic reticulum ATPase
MVHRFFKRVEEFLKNGKNVIFLYGDNQFMSDLFLTNDELLEIRESIKGMIWDKVRHFVEIYKEGYKIKLKTDLDFSRKINIKDDLGQYSTFTKNLSEESFNDLQSFINYLKQLNDYLFKNENVCVIFDDFESICEIHRGFNSENLALIFKETILNWKKTRNYYFIIIRENQLGKLEDFGITINDAINVSEPSIIEIAITLNNLAKNYNKRLYFPIGTAKKLYFEKEKLLRNIKNDFESRIRNIKEREILLLSTDEKEEEEWTLDKIRIDEKIKDEIRLIFSNFRDGKLLVNGIILYGPPGTGKTTIARALANEFEFYFMKASASDFKGEFIGQSVQNTRRIFEKLRNNKPALLLVDEADAILCKRDANRSDSYTNEIVNEFLANVDGLKEDKEIFIVVSTNNLHLLDSAIRSRFKEIEIPLPRGEELRQIVSDYLGEEWEEYYNYFEGFSGRDIRNIGNKLKALGNKVNKEEFLREVILEKLKKSVSDIEISELNFSKIVGFEKQKKEILDLLNLGIRKFVIIGDVKSGKTTFIKAFSGEIKGIIIYEIPSSIEIIKNIKENIILLINESNLDLIEEIEKFENYENLIVIVELRSNKIIEFLKNLGFEEIRIWTDRETIKSYINKYYPDFDGDISELEGKSFLYIENYLKKWRYKK